MPKKSFTEEQIAAALRLAESGTAVADVRRKFGVTEVTFYRWKKRFAGMGVAELRRLKQLEEENRRLKQLVADLTLDKAMLQEVTRVCPGLWQKSSEAREEAGIGSISEDRLQGQPETRLPRSWRGAFRHQVQKP